MMLFCSLAGVSQPAAISPRLHKCLTPPFTTVLKCQEQYVQSSSAAFFSTYLHFLSLSLIEKGHQVKYFILSAPQRKVPAWRFKILSFLDELDQNLFNITVTLDDIINLHEVYLNIYKV